MAKVFQKSTQIYSYILDPRHLGPMNRDFRKSKVNGVVAKVSRLCVSPRGHLLDVDPGLNCHVCHPGDMTVGKSMYLCIDTYAMSFGGKSI